MQIFGQAWRSGLVALITLALFYGAFAPALSLAQEDDLSAAIRAALLADPNTSGLSQADLDVLVAALAEQARADGMTAHDIQWQPTDPALLNAEASSQESACTFPAVLCAFSEAFGFTGEAFGIPIVLGFLSALLLLLIGSILLHQGRHPIAGSLRPAQTPPTSNDPQQPSARLYQ